MSYDNRNVPRLWFHHAEEKIGGGNGGNDVRTLWDAHRF